MECEEYYQLAPEYRRTRLAALNAARQYEVEEARLPSARLWGRYERLKRNDREFQPLLPHKVQSEAVGCKSDQGSGLEPVKTGGLGWRLPPISEPAPGTLDQLESWCFIVENLLYLVGWCKDMRNLETFHNRFWSRVRANRVPRPGYCGLTVQEYVDAYLTFQNQWKKASRSADHLDTAILASLPAENDELDGRLALAPRLAVQTIQPPEAETRKRSLASEDGQTHASFLDEPTMPAKAQKLNRGERQKRKIAALEAELQSTRPQTGKGKGKAGNRGGKAQGKKGAAGDRDGPKKAAKGAAWCKHFAETGQCPFGDKCWFRHT